MSRSTVLLSALGAIVVSSALAACRSKPQKPQPVEASFRTERVELKPLHCSFEIALTTKSTEDNKRILRALFDSHPEWGNIEHASDTQIGELVSTRWTCSLDLENSGQLEKIARALATVQDRAGQRMLAHNRAEAFLRFVSTDAIASSQAVVSFEVTPADAQLFVVTPLPGVSATSAYTGSVTIPLSFSFIREHRFVYFYSEHEGLRKYYRYAIAEERKEELSSVRSLADLQELARNEP